MTKEEIKADWKKSGEYSIKQAIDRCQTIVDSGKYAADIVVMVKDTQIMLLDLLREQHLVC